MQGTTNPSRKPRCLRVAAVASFLFVLALQAAYSSDVPSAPVKGKSSHESAISTRPFRHFAVGVTAGTFGPGIEVATTLSRRSNLRVDGSFLNYSQSLTENGINYNGNLRLRDYRASYDFYPFGGAFRLSAGFAAYNQFNVHALATVAAGQTITLNDVDYYSNPNDPLAGTATLAYTRKYAPTATFGWGNAIPRSGRHLAFPVEIGVAFTGTPAFTLNMAGSACSTPVPSAETCGDVTTYDGFQSNLTAQRQKITNDLAPFRVYPIINLGVTYRF
jgi:hypothetical protein